MPTPEEDIEHLKSALKSVEKVSLAGLTIGMQGDLGDTLDVLEVAIKVKQRLAEERKAKA